MKQDLISIIIPVYNVQDYLHECVESVLNQNYTNFELILINDGSKDASANICEQFAQKDERVVVYHTGNHGVAAARAFGLAKAKGEYITFVDSDDLLRKDALLKMYQEAMKQNAQIVCCSFIRFSTNLKIPFYPSIKTRVYNSKDILKELLLNRRMKNYLWGKLIHKDVLKSVDFTTKRIFEDISVIHQLFLNANKVVLIAYYGYCYRVRKNSLTAQMQVDKLIKMKDAFIYQQECIADTYPDLRYYSYDPLCMSDIMILACICKDIKNNYIYTNVLSNYKINQVSIPYYVAYHYLKAHFKVKKLINRKKLINN